MDAVWLAGRVRENVRLLKALREMSDTDLAKAGGFTSRQVISARTSGRTDISVEDIARLAVALRVEPHVLLLSSAEAIAWAEAHRRYSPRRLSKQHRSKNKVRPRRDEHDPRRLF